MATVDFRWKLREIMASRGLFKTIDLREPLKQAGIDLSVSQVHRLVTRKPQRISVATLMTLTDILECNVEDLVDTTYGRRTTTTAKIGTTFRRGDGQASSAPDASGSLPTS